MDESLILKSAVADPIKVRELRITLRQLFIATLAALSVMLAVLFYLFFEGSRKSIDASGQRLRELAARDIESRVGVFLSQATLTADDIEIAFKQELISQRNLERLESAIVAKLIERPGLAEISITFAKRSGKDKSDRIVLAEEGRESLNVYRLPGAPARLLSWHVFKEKELFVSERHQWLLNGGFGSAPWVRDAGATRGDPTDDPTFATPASSAFYGKALWSDLHYAHVDGSEFDRSRVVVTVQKAIEDRSAFIGVVRVGLWTDQLDSIAKLKLTDEPGDPHRVFICDRDGKLVTRLSAADVFVETDQSLRVSALNPPAEIGAALADPARTQLSGERQTASFGFASGGKNYFATFRALEGTQDWVIGIVVPQEAYLGGLLGARNRLLWQALLVIACILIGGIATLRLVKGDLARVADEMGRMQQFDFSPARVRARLVEIRHIVDGLEQSKTAMRAMSKYVPVALVRQLHEKHAEPALGSALHEVTLMFTDIEGFTTVAEQMEPNELARALGLYFKAMTEAIHSEAGTIDKFIGDAVMAFWNAPVPLRDHARHGCAAALACVRATDALFRSPAWLGRPKWYTRYGLHRDRVMIGHFGAPDRLNYTAIGDGVNIASRLEGLNKEHGTHILASESVYEDARDAFDFREIGVVTVKGKQKSLSVYELLGSRETAAKGRNEKWTRASC